MKKGILFILVAAMVLTNYSIVAQTQAPYYPSSPTLSEVNAGITVNEYTGALNVSVPIYTVVSGDVTVPISLNYNATGNKVQETASWVGLGWNLNCQYAIKRIAYGGVDQYNTQNNVYSFANGYNLESEIEDGNIIDQNGQSTPLIDHINSLDQGYSGINFQPDVFSYSFPGGSGSFTFDTQGNLIKGDDNLHKIEVVSRFEWIITGDNGFKYRYGAPESENTTVIVENDAGLAPIFGSNIDHSITSSPYLEYTNLSGHESTSRFTSGWYLREIISPTGSSVTFKYEKNSAVGKMITNHIYLEKHSVEDESVTEEFISNYSTAYYDMRRLSRIEFDNGYVSFILKTEPRIDLPNNYALEYINVYNEAFPGTEIKRSFKLLTSQILTSNLIPPAHYTPQICEKYHLTLDRLVELFPDNQECKALFGFEYNDLRLPMTSSRAVDYWGYYNGHIGNSSLIPQYNAFFDDNNITNFSFEKFQHVYSNASNDRRSVEEYMKAEILEKITYPTGGYTEFTYQANDFYNAADHTNMKGAGLRIHEIIDHSNSSEISNYKKYIYTDRQTNQSFGKLIGKPKFDGQLRLFEQSIGENGYLEWTEYDCFYKGVNNIMDYSSGMYVGYDKVIEYNDVNMQNGRIEKTFNNIAYGTIEVDKPIFLDSRNGLVSSVKYFSSTKLMKDVQYNYSNILLAKNTGIIITDIPHGKESEKPFWTDVTFKHYSIETRRTTLTETIDIEHDKYSDETITTNTTFDYDATTGQLLSTSRVTNDGKVKRARFKYPLNYYNPAFMDVATTGDRQSRAIYKMIEDNIVSGPIEKISTEVFKDGVEYVTQAGLTKFKINTYGDKSLVVPSQIEVMPESGSVVFDQNIFSTITYGSPDSYTFNIHSAYEPVTFIDYVNEDGIVLQQHDRYGLPVSYFYEQAGKYITATAYNANHDEIYYNSFEDDGVVGLSKSGEKYHNGDLNFVFPLPLGTTKTYKLSYWYFENNLWKYKEVPYLFNGGTTSVTDGDRIDEVRIYPTDADMATVNWKPFPGKISETDAKGNTTYYEYVNGELSCVRDNDRNIIQYVKTNLGTFGASICYEAEPLIVGEAITFSNCIIDSSPNTPLSYSWDMDDGFTFYCESPVCTYASPGMKTVKLVISNSLGEVLYNGQISILVVDIVNDGSKSFEQTTNSWEKLIGLSLEWYGSGSLEFEWSVNGSVVTTVTDPDYQLLLSNENTNGVPITYNVECKVTDLQFSFSRTFQFTVTLDAMSN